MSRIRFGVMFFVVTACFMWTVSMAFAGENQDSVEKAATVNGVVISNQEFEREFNVVKQKIESKGKRISDSQMPQLKKDVLEGLIKRELLYQESQKMGIKVEDGAVNEQYAKLREKLSEEEFNEAMKNMGLSESDIKAQIKRGMATHQFVDSRFIQNTTVSDKEMQDYYDGHRNLFIKPEQVRASHILIKVDPEADEAAKAKARKDIEEIQKKVADGKDFAELAKEFSEGPSGPRGGDLGYFRRGQMVKPFEDAAFELGPGQVSGIVETNFGFHIIKVVDKSPETELAFDEVKKDGRLEEYLKSQKVQKQIDEFTKGLESNSKVEIFYK